MDKKMTFSSNLYLGESINSQNLKKLKYKLIHRPFMTRIFLVTISSNPEEQLDIIESKYLTFPYYNEHPVHVVGLAGSHTEAIKLVEQIANDCLKKRDDINMRAYFLEETSKTL